MNTQVRSKGVVEKRYIPFRKVGLREAKLDANGKLLRDAKGNAIDAGGFTAYGNVKGYLDTHGTIMWHGCYVQCLDDFIAKGFVPDTHGAAFNYTPVNESILAYINDAKEDDYGLWLDASFHSTDDAQDSRIKYTERMNAGKECGNSIGFSIDEFFTIMPKDYEALIPKYSLPEFVEQNLARAQSMWCVDICTQITVMESSLTLIPSNEASIVEEIRSGKKGKSKTLVTVTGDLFNRTKVFKDFSSQLDGMLKRIETMEIAERSALAADVNSFSSQTIKDIITMANYTSRKKDKEDDDDDAKMQDVRDAHQDASHALDKLGRHLDHMGDMHRDGEKLHRDAEKALDKLGKCLDDAKAPKEEEDPEGKDKKDKRAREIAERYSN